MIKYFSLFSKKMELLLSWYRRLSLIFYPCAVIKYRFQQMAGMKSSTPTIYVSVGLFVLIFCFVEITIGKRHPKYKPPPECPCVVVWTANNALTHHFKIPLPLALRVSLSLLVPLRYHIRYNNLTQFSSLGARTIVFRNSMYV